MTSIQESAIFIHLVHSASLMLNAIMRMIPFHIAHILYAYLSNHKRLVKWVYCEIIFVCQHLLSKGKQSK